MSKPVSWKDASGVLWIYSSEMLEWLIEHYSAEYYAMKASQPAGDEEDEHG